MHIALLQQPPPHRLARAALEQDVVGDDDRGAPVDGEQRPDVLQEVELREAGPGLGLAVAVPVPVDLDAAPGQASQGASERSGSSSAGRSGNVRPAPG